MISPNFLLVPAALAALCALAPAALAETPLEKGPSMALFDRFAGADHELDEAGYARLLAAMMGGMNPREQAAVHGSWTSLLAQNDRDHDGKLSRAEWEHHIDSFMRIRHRFERIARMQADLMKRFDRFAGPDHRIDRSSFRQMLADTRARKGADGIWDAMTKLHALDPADRISRADFKRCTSDYNLQRSLDPQIEYDSLIGEFDRCATADDELDRQGFARMAIGAANEKRPSWDQLLARYDQDHDGRLSRAEWERFAKDTSDESPAIPPAQSRM